MAQPAPLQPVIASKPWELVAVDILKVPMSSSGNQYILVAQDYFSKWPFARAMPDQKADRIVKILRDEVFTLVGPPCKLHSDQGRNFESHILSDLCKAFHVAKSHTTPYHPMGDGLVERMNRSLLSLLRSFVEKEGEWEQHLQFLLYIYRTLKHSSNGLSPFEIIFGSNPPSLHIPDFRTTAILDPGDYVSGLQQKLMELRELVDASLVESASKQEHFYNSSQLPQFKKGQKVLLNNPTKGKLDPRWTGPWVVQHQNNTTLRIKKGSRDQTVHVNRVRPLLEREEQMLSVQIGVLHCFTITLRRDLQNHLKHQRTLVHLKYLGVPLAAQASNCPQQEVVVWLDLWNTMAMTTELTGLMHTQIHRL